MIRWPDGPTSSDADSTCRIGRKKADEDQLQPTVRNTLRKLSRLTKKNCPTADRRLGQSEDRSNNGDSGIPHRNLLSCQQTRLSYHISFKEPFVALTCHKNVRECQPRSSENS
ncbi:hypothetical protein DPX16_10276 [Anabarilius grahami]|uniref:Uncharacterized protein n=1 Tax=Anabarilius grahami TaxID=495550 RepID=A0A3N0YCQ2_ANAGA|nr:hypothetical protein DPX16_10276 [Anabarilius grahami]